MGEKLNLKLTYSIEEAAKFLNISTIDIIRLTNLGYLTKYKQQRREYYLGGALDDIKPRLKKILPMLDLEEDAELSLMCS